MTHALDRRSLLLGAGAAALAGCGGGRNDYAELLAHMTAPLPSPPDLADLVRYATLAASGHNTQPWRFRPVENTLAITPDFTRRTPVVDPDDHHLYASLGCATENLALAARARGLSGDTRFDPEDDGAIYVDLTPAPAEEGALFAAIPSRQNTRSLFDGRALPTDAVDRLIAAAAVHDVDALYIADTAPLDAVLELVVAGAGRQMDDPAFVRELQDWIRFNPTSAAEKGDGLYAAASGNPTLPTWMGELIFPLVFTKTAETKKYAEQIRSSAGALVLVAPTNDPAGWIAAGRAYQRIALQATADGIRHAMINQTVEDLSARADLQNLLSLGERRPNLVLRLGYADLLPRSTRRPASAVLG